MNIGKSDPRPSLPVIDPAFGRGIMWDIDAAGREYLRPHVSSAAKRKGLSSNAPVLVDPPTRTLVMALRQIFAPPASPGFFAVTESLHKKGPPSISVRFWPAQHGMENTLTPLGRLILDAPSGRRVHFVDDSAEGRRDMRFPNLRMAFAPDDEVAPFRRPPRPAVERLLIGTAVAMFRAYSDTAHHGELDAIAGECMDRLNAAFAAYHAFRLDMAALYGAAFGEPPAAPPPAFRHWCDVADAALGLYRRKPALEAVAAEAAFMG